MNKKALGAMLMLIEYSMLAFMLFLMHYSIDYSIRLLFLYLLLQYLLGHYHIRATLIWEEIRQLLTSHFCFFLGSLILVPARALTLPLFFKNLFIVAVLFCFDLFLSRYLRIWLREKIAERVLIIGVGKEACSLYEVCRDNRFAMMSIKGFIDTGHTKLSQIKDDEELSKLVHPLSELEKVLKEEEITELMLTIPDLTKNELEHIMSIAGRYVKNIKYIPRINGLVTFDSDIEDFDGLIVISRTAREKSRWQKAVKRIIDILGGLAGCVLLIPLTLYVRHVNRKHGDHDPIFFKQMRIGKEGKGFEMYKFRTMVPGAEELLKEMMEKDPAIREEYQTNKKLKDDPRITEAGKFLRRCSLDEFPQLINVLKGEMSLVGPRPYLPGEREDMGYYYKSIIGSKPGITGMWQSHGRNDVGFMDRCEMDDYYYQNWSLWLDMTILIKTVKSVKHHTGAM